MPSRLGTRFGGPGAEPAVYRHDGPYGSPMSTAGLDWDEPLDPGEAGGRDERPVRPAPAAGAGVRARLR